MSSEEEEITLTNQEVDVNGSPVTEKDEEEVLRDLFGKPDVLGFYTGERQ